MSFVQVHVISMSERFLLSKVEFTCSFFRILYEQLNFSPTDFFETELSRDNFLKPVLTNLLSSTDIDNGDARLMENRKRFLNFIRKKFSILREDSSQSLLPGQRYYDMVDENLPVVVDLEPARSSDEEQAPALQFFASSGSAMSRHEIDCALYSWRYPALYDSMEVRFCIFICTRLSSYHVNLNDDVEQVGEDLVMAATRILDENQTILEAIEATLRRQHPLGDDINVKKVNEAYLFMRDEIAHRAEVSL